MHLLLQQALTCCLCTMLEIGGRHLLLRDVGVALCAPESPSLDARHLELPSVIYRRIERPWRS